MKKSIMILLSIFLLAACGNNEPTTEYPSTMDESNKGGKEQPSTQQNGEEDQPSTQSNEEEVSEESEETPQISNANNDHLNNYEELPILSTHIDLNTYTGTVETDNKGKRIIIFANNDGQNEYKSIFIKHDNRLKIVTFNGESPLYNDVIQ